MDGNHHKAVVFDAVLGQGFSGAHSKHRVRINENDTAKLRREFAGTAGLSP